MIQRVARFDEAADHALDSIRGNRVVDRLMFSASAVGDFSAIWQAINLVGAVAGRHSWRWALSFALCMAAESLIVNQGVKRLFKRRRPDAPTATPHQVRRPRTSSFPSGHASAATVAAMLLSSEHPREAPLWVAAAVIVALSRPYVRVHHASDVAGGIFVGGLLGAIFLMLPLR